MRVYFDFTVTKSKRKLLSLCSYEHLGQFLFNPNWSFIFLNKKNKGKKGGKKNTVENTCDRESLAGSQVATFSIERFYLLKFSPCYFIICTRKLAAAAAAVPVTLALFTQPPLSTQEELSVSNNSLLTRKVLRVPAAALSPCSVGGQKHRSSVDLL